MTRRIARLLVAAVVILTGCQGSSNVSCSLVGGTQLAPTTWPKFRADVANTGRADVDLSTNDGTGTLLFDGSCFDGTMQLPQTCTRGVNDGRCADGRICPTPCASGETCPTPSGRCCAAIGSVSTSPILGPTQDTEPSNVYLASADGNVYLLNPLPTPTSVPPPTPSLIQVGGAILGSPLLGADGTLFVPSNGQLEQFLSDGVPKNVAPLIGFAAAAPNMWTVDGTVFVATQAGSLSAVCPNGVPRFTVTGPGTQATTLVLQDPHYVPTPSQTPTIQTAIIVVGGVNGQVRAYALSGSQYWSFFASDNIVAALMADVNANVFYVADTAGHVFAVDLTSGQGLTTDQGLPKFVFATDEFAPGERPAITASPALGSDDAAVPTLYVADVGHLPQRGGLLYALDRTTGKVRWEFPDTKRGDDPLEGPISSSPAVATGGEQDVIVFAADVIATVDGTPVAVGGKVYAVRDDGEHGTLLWTFDAEHSIGSSSPSIGIDGRVYIGRQGNRLGTATECPNPDRACVVSEGGGLYAIGPTPLPTATPGAATPTSA